MPGGPRLTVPGGLWPGGARSGSSESPPTGVTGVGRGMLEHSTGGGPGRFTVSDVLGPWSGRECGRQ